MRMGIVDVGIGNLGSLQGALYSEGWDSERVDCPEAIRDLSHLIIPGVGTFFEGMSRLDARGMSQAIREHALMGKPTMGICLGMQLLSDFGSEGGGKAGLGLVPGEVHRMLVPDNCKLPHVGWNSITINAPHPVMRDIKSDVDFYFVHSFCFTTSKSEYILAETTYGKEFASIIANGNVIGFQFHPEKSQRNGLKIIENFCVWDGDA